MSRRRKLVLFLIIAPLVLIVAVVAALFNSSVQTFAARKVLAGQGEVGSVAVGLSGANITGLKIEQPGIRISSPSFVAEAPLLDLARGRIDVRSVVAHDIVIDYDPVVAAEHAAKTPKTEKTNEPSKPFAGVLGAVKLPADFRIQNVDIAGVVRIAGPQPVTARFSLTGGGVATNSTGKITLSIDADAGSAGTVVTTVDLAPTLDASGQLSALALAIKASAQGGALKAPAALSADLAATREGTTELYKINLAVAEKTLVSVDTRWAPGAQSFPGTWKLALADTDLKPFLPSFFILPTLRLDGSGEITLSGTEKLTASGNLELFADALERLGLPELGALKLVTHFNVESSGTEHRVNTFGLTVAAGSVPVLAVETRQAFGVESATGVLKPVHPDAELATVRLLGVPAAWLKPYAPDLVIDGPITAVFSARPAGDGFVVESTEAFRLTGVRYGELATLEAISLDGIRMEKTSAGLAATVRSLRVTGEGVDLISGDISAAQKTGEALAAKIALKFNLAKLADQPALRGKTRIAAGQATLALDATLADTVRAALSLQLTDLRAAGVTGELPSIGFKADLTRDAAGVVSIKLPLTVLNAAPARTSDLDIAATLTPGTPDQNLVVKLTSRELYVPDLQAFSALATDSAPANSSEKQSAPASTPAPAQTGPIWAGYTGRIEVDLARVIYAPGLEFPNTKGSIALTPEALSLEKIQTMLSSGGALDLTGMLRWLAPTKSYALTADVSGRDVAIGPLLKALNPAAAPALEGTYAVTGTVTGQGSDPAAAVSNAAADIKLTGKQGVLRALDLDTNRYAKAGNALSGLAGLAGALSGNAQISERANQITALNSIARRLGNLSYDELVLDARRGADGTINIGELRLKGPDVLLTGAGSIQALAGRTFTEQPLSLNLDLGTRGDFARELTALRVLKPLAEGASADAFCTLAQPLVLDGTLKKIGTSQVTRLLTQSLGL